MPNNKTEEISNLQKFILEAPLYREYKITLEVLDALREFDQPLDFYCSEKECRKDSIFKRDFGFKREFRHEGASTEPPKRDTFNIEFECSRNENHRAIFVFTVNNNLIRKIGEQPSHIERLRAGLSKYDKELGEYAKEFKMAVHLSTFDINIGAFAYLRRVFEFVVINAAKKKAQKDSGWDIDEWKKNPGMDSKLKEIKEYLPSFIVDNGNLYQVLSKGLHELTEEDCKEHFNNVRYGIRAILDEVLNEKRQKENARKAASGVQSSHRDLKDK